MNADKYIFNIGMVVFSLMMLLLINIIFRYLITRLHKSLTLIYINIKYKSKKYLTLKKTPILGKTKKQRCMR